MPKYVVTLISSDGGKIGMRLDQVEAETPQEAADKVTTRRQDPEGTSYSVRVLEESIEPEAAEE